MPTVFVMNDLWFLFLQSCFETVTITLWVSEISVSMELIHFSCSVAGSLKINQKEMIVWNFKAGLFYNNIFLIIKSLQGYF